MGLATISYDSTEILAAFSREHEITFPLLSDVGSATIKSYGILNTVVGAALASTNIDPALKAQVARYVTGAEPAERHMGIPFPSTFVVDAQGRVTSRFMEDSYRERTTISNIMVQTGVGEAPVQGTTVSTDHLELTTYPSDAAISRMNHFSLVLDVTPRPGMHVYAPGAESYRIISLSLAPEFVSPLSLTYPDSEIYYFEPFDERVPVYQKPFRLLQEVVLENQPDGDSVTVTGTLDYQACDDKICYNPVSVPLSWTLSLRPRVGRVTANPQ